jgi:hypothetical protein
MPERMLLPELIYGLSVVDGRRTVRPGEVVGLRFRLRNRNPDTSPAARVTFDLPAGWTPIDPLDAAFPPLEPGADACVQVRASAATADAVGAPALFQAALHVAGAVLGSNLVALHLAGRPVLDGPGSGIRIEPTEHADRLRIVATVVNAGDAPACGVRVVVPPPPGFTADSEAFARSCAEIVPGASFELAYEATALSPTCGIVSVDDGYASSADRRVRIPTVAAHALAARIAPPDVVLERTAQRLDATVRIRNEGWIPARDVTCRIELPNGWRLLAGTALIDDAPATVIRSGRGERGDTVAVPLVAPRSAASLRFVAVATRARPDELVRIRCAGQQTERAIGPGGGSIRVVARSETAFVTPGGEAHVLVYAQNLMPSAESITFTLNGKALRECGLRARATIAFDTTAFAPPDASDGTMARFTIAALSANGTTLADDTVELRVVGPTAPACDDDAPVGAGVRPPAVGATWNAPAQTAAGERCDVHLTIRAECDVDSLHVRPQLPAEDAYVAGSTTVNGCGIVDERDGPPLFADGGLALYGIGAGTSIDIGWAIVAHAGGARDIGAAIVADGDALAIAPHRLAVIAPPPFGIRARALPFHVDAATIGDAPVAAAFAPPAPIAAIALPPRVTFALELDAPCRNRIVRLLCGARGPGMTGHLAPLAALFPTAVGGGDPHVAAALAAAREAVRDVYERLFVKARVPGYEVTPYDLEDAELRRSLGALLAAAADGACGEEAAPAGAVSMTIERTELAAAAARLDGAPLGGALAVATLAALLPRNGSGEAAGWLATYAALLAAELDECRELTLEAFSAYVMMHRAPFLDRARDDAVLALEAAATAAA